MAITVQPSSRPFAVAARPIVRSERLAGVSLGGVLVLALGLRLWGLSWGLPWAFHPDEVFYVDQAQDMVKYGDPNPRYFRNPSLLTYLLAGEMLVIRALGPLAGSLSPTSAGSGQLLARLDSALLGAASVALTFALGRALFGRSIGLLGALILAASFLHVRDSHYGVNDVPAVGLLLLSLYFDARLMRGPRLRWYLLAGLAGGLATSTKYNMGLFFVPLLVAHALTQGRTTTGLVVAAAASITGYLAGTPFTLLDVDRFWAGFTTQYSFGSSRWLGQPIEPVPLLYLTSLLQGLGGVALVLGLFGLARASRARLAETLLLVSFPVAYLAFLLPKALFFPRFAIPMLPILCLFAAYACSELARSARPSWQPAALAALLTAVLAQPLLLSLLHDRAISQADTRRLANEWAQANLPPGSRLKIEDYSLRDLSTQARTYTPNSADLKIERFEGSPEAEQARYFADRNVQYVVTSSFNFDRYLLDPPYANQQDSGQRYQRLHRSLEQRAEQVAHFGPGPGGTDLPYSLDNTLTPFWNLEQFEHPGPTIRIYSLAPLSSGGP